MWAWGAGEPQGPGPRAAEHSPTGSREDTGVRPVAISLCSGLVLPGCHTARGPRLLGKVGEAPRGLGERHWKWLCCWTRSGQSLPGPCGWCRGCPESGSTGARPQAHPEWHAHTRLALRCHLFLVTMLLQPATFCMCAPTSSEAGGPLAGEEGPGRQSQSMWKWDQWPGGSATG